MDRRQFMQRSALAALGTLGALSTRLAHAHTDPFPGLATRVVESLELDADGSVLATHRSVARLLTLMLPADTPLSMVAIPRTRLALGIAPGEKHCGPYDCPPREVEVEPFLLGMTAVTQAQWRAVAALPPVARDLAPAPSCFDGAEHPVECVSALDADEFCARLTRATGASLRLPSEAEWEVACRAGARTPFNLGATLTGAHAHYAASHVYRDESPRAAAVGTAPVALHAPNALGLHDMHGNVWEWCADAWKDSRAGHGNERAQFRTLRGGSWADSPGKLRAASRSGYPAAGLNRLIGLRVAMTLA